MTSFSSNSLITGQTNFNRYMAVALPGMLSGIGTNQIYPHTNTVSALDTVTITPPATVDANKTYTVYIGAASVSFTTDATPTAAKLSAGLFAAIQIEPVFYSLVDVSLNPTSNVLTLTARTVDYILSVTSNANDTTNDLAIAKTVIASRNQIIPFGRFVGRKSNYPRDPREGVSAATLIDSASGYEILGVTLQSNATEKVGRFGNAKDGYAFGYVMNVLKNIGTYKGVWVEAVDADLVIGDSAYIATTASNEGKITKSSSGNLNASANVKIISATEQVFNKYIALCEIRY